MYVPTCCTYNLIRVFIKTDDPVAIEEHLQCKVAGSNLAEPRDFTGGKLTNFLDLHWWSALGCGQN